VLYENSFDLLFHRLCYWADGRRSLLEIADRLEFEMAELMSDRGIARTVSGVAIEPSSPQVSLEAVESMAEVLEGAGYLV